MAMIDKVHDLIHRGLEQSPDPISGATAGATSGALIGTVTALHGAGVTVGGIVATAHVVGVGATVTACAAIAGPVILPAAACCAVFGGLYGLKNWLEKH